MNASITVRQFLSLVMHGGLANGCRIYDYYLHRTLYSGMDCRDIPEEYFNYKVVNFYINKAGVLEINVNTNKG